MTCLPQKLVEDYDIHLVPCDLIFEDRAYRDGVDITPSEFYTLLQQSDKLPTTSAPSPGAYLEAYREVSKTSNEILCITCSSKVTNIFERAQLAREVAREAIPQATIEVLDSVTMGGGQGWVVIAAARAAAQGYDLAQVIQAAKLVIPRVNVLALFDTLYYLAKGGRIPRVFAWAGSLLSIKPIIHVPDGEIHFLQRVRTKPRAVQRLLELMSERIGREQAVHVIVMHANVPDEAETLKQQILSRFNCTETYVTDFTPVMGTHTGPGTLALAFYGDD